MYLVCGGLCLKLEMSDGTRQLTQVTKHCTKKLHAFKHLPALFQVVSNILLQDIGCQSAAGFISYRCSHTVWHSQKDVNVNVDCTEKLLPF